MGRNKKARGPPQGDRGLVFSIKKSRLDPESVARSLLRARSEAGQYVTVVQRVDDPIAVGIVLATDSRRVGILSESGQDRTGIERIDVPVAVHIAVAVGQPVEGLAEV